MKNRLAYFFITLIFIIAITLPISSTNSKSTTMNATWAKVRISVFDEQNQPINMATICVIETNEYFSTEKLGICELAFSINLKDNIFVSQKWDEFTLLIYKNGYIPHIIYGLKAIPNITRTGIVITLKAPTNQTEITFTQSYDFPSKDQTTIIINKHKK